MRIRFFCVVFFVIHFFCADFLSAAPENMKEDFMLPEVLNGRSKLLFYGDSLTDGSSYPDYVLHSLNAAFPETGWTLENSGKCGDTTRDLLRRFDEDVAAKNPDLLSICIGANDLKHVPVDEYKTNLMALVEKAVSADIQPVLMLPTPRADQDADNSLQPFLKAMRDVAGEYKIPLVDSYGLFKQWQEAGKVVLGPDGLHHGPDGFPAMARAFLDGLGLENVELVEKVVPWPGALTDWEVSSPVIVTAEIKDSFFKLENAKGWKVFSPEEALSCLEWYDRPFVQRGAILPLAGVESAAGKKRVAFGRAVFVSDRAVEAELRIGGSPPMYIYCNGELVWQQTVAHGYHPNADRINVKLKKGRNEFVVCTGFMAFLNLLPAESSD